MPEASSFPLRSTALALAWLALFALFYSIGEEVGAWPSLPLGELGDLDLVAGFLAGVTVLVALLAPDRTLRTGN